MRKLERNATVVVATHNAGKLREIGELLSPFSFSAVSAADCHLPEPEETGTTFAENARIKALAAAQQSGKPALADDSGLVVHALDGAPGIYSARWAGPHKDFAVAMAEIEFQLRAKNALTAKDRGAAFVCALCLAWPDAHVEEVEGRIDGRIVWPPRGEKGFGYDPIFMPHGYPKTFGEMTAEQKHGWKPGQGDGLSHRARAFSQLAHRCFLPLAQI